MTRKDKETIQKQLEKIESVAALLPPAYGHSLRDATKTISFVLSREENE